MLRLDEPGLTHRTASIATVLTAAAMEGTVQIELKLNTDNAPAIVRITDRIPEYRIHFLDDTTTLLCLIQGTVLMLSCRV